MVSKIEVLPNEQVIRESRVFPRHGDNWLSAFGEAAYDDRYRQSWRQFETLNRLLAKKGSERVEMIERLKTIAVTQHSRLQICHIGTGMGATSIALCDFLHQYLPGVSLEMVGIDEDPQAILGHRRLVVEQRLPARLRSFYTLTLDTYLQAQAQGHLPRPHFDLYVGLHVPGQVVSRISELFFSPHPDLGQPAAHRQSLGLFTTVQADEQWDDNFPDDFSLAIDAHCEMMQANEYPADAILSYAYLTEVPCRSHEYGYMIGYRSSETTAPESDQHD